jgi:hypothetical protein
MQIDRPSRESRGASVLEAARVHSGGGFSGNHRCSCDEQSSLVSPVLGRDGSGRHGFGCWVARVSAGALQPESDSECPLSLQHAVAGALRKERLRAQRASFFRGLAPLAGKGRASARATTGDGCSTSVERPEPLGSGLSLVACHRRLSRAKARDCPGFGTTWQGVSRAGRVRDCVVRARVLIAKTDAEGAQTMGAPSSTLRQQKSGLGGRPTPRGGDRSSAEGEERFGARWNGLTNESLVVPPVRHHGPGATDAVARVLATLGGPAGSPALPSPSRGAGLRAGAPKRVSLAQVCEPLR